MYCSKLSLYQDDHSSDTLNYNFNHNCIYNSIENHIELISQYRIL